jgi:hypothetical protein
VDTLCSSTQYETKQLETLTGLLLSLVSSVETLSLCLLTQVPKFWNKEQHMVTKSSTLFLRWIPTIITTFQYIMLGLRSFSLMFHSSDLTETIKRFEIPSILEITEFLDFAHPSPGVLKQWYTIWSTSTPGGARRHLRGCLKLKKNSYILFRDKH